MRVATSRRAPGGSAPAAPGRPAAAPSSAPAPTSAPQSARRQGAVDLLVRGRTRPRRSGGAGAYRLWYVNFRPITLRYDLGETGSLLAA